MTVPKAATGWHIPIWTAGIPVLLYTVLLAGFSPAGFPSGVVSQGWLPWLADKPVGEDGFYMLTVAWNIASGQGPVGQPGTKPTTGIQPLATAVLAAIAWLVRSVGGDKWGFVRSVIVFGGVSTVLFSFLLGRLAARLAPAETRVTAASITLSLGLGSFFLFRLFTYGLETGVYLIMICVVVLRSLTVFSGPKTRHSAMALGVLVGLTGLARIDFGIVFAVAASVLLLSGVTSFRWLVGCGSTAFLIVAPWFIWIHHASGNPIPSSGLAQASIATGTVLLGRLVPMASALVQDITPWTFTGGRLPLTLITIFGWAMVAVVLRSRPLPRPVSPAVAAIVLAWVAGFVALIPIYTIFFWSSHFYARYMAPLSVLAFPVIGSGLAAFFATLPEWRYVKLVYGAMLVSFFLCAAGSLHAGHIGNTHVLAAGFVQTHFSAELVGAFQSGVVGYFNDNALNLDGKINGEALRAIRTRKLAEYIDGAGVEVLIDWPEVLRASLGESYLQNQWEECKTQPPLHKSLCLRRIH